MVYRVKALQKKDRKEMNTPDQTRRNRLKDEKADGPSVLGRFFWTVVGKSCIPCLLKSDGTKFVSVRIAEAKVLTHFLMRLNAEVFKCVHFKNFGITEPEMKLLNEINSKHCEFAFGREPFTMDTDFIMKFDDLIEFFQFLDTCCNKLSNQTSTSNKHKCGFVRVNDDSIVPYVVKNDQKYVPLFYFEGETDNLGTKAINLENWDLAYLKFGCKVQGFPDDHELFANEHCPVISLEDVKSHFPDDTKFDDYWPTKVIKMQTPNWKDLNGNHSWVQTPHIDSSATVSQSSPSVPNPTHTLANGTSQSALMEQLVQNKPKPSPNLTINNVSTPTYTQPNTWLGNTQTLNSPHSGSYTIGQTVQQQRTPPKQTPVTLHSMNTNAMAPRTCSSQAVRTCCQQHYCNATTNDVPSVPVSQTQPPPPLVIVHPTSMSNVYSNAISGSIYSPAMYSTAPVYSLPNTQSPTIYMNTTPAVPLTSKARPTNQVERNTRYPSALTPITTTVIQSNTSTVIGAMSTNNTLVAGSRNRVVPNTPGGDEIIDLTSPPHSPQTITTNMNDVPLGSTASYTNYMNTSKENPNIVKIAECNSAPHTFPYKIRTIYLGDKQVQAINLEPNNHDKMGIALHTLTVNYFSQIEATELKEILIDAFRCCVLYEANSLQMLVLREAFKFITNDDDLLLMKSDDFNIYYKPLLYVVQTGKLQKSGGGDPKRHN